MTTAVVALLAALVCTPRPPRVQSVELQVPVMPREVRSAGRNVMVYELHITNLRPFQAALSRVEIWDAVRGTRMLELTDAALTQSLGKPGGPGEIADKKVLGPGVRVVAYFWIPLEPGGVVPAKLRHRVELTLVRPQGAQPVAVEDQPIAVKREAVPVLGPPLRGGPWVALYDPQMSGGHRTAIYTLGGRARIPARFAIDFVKLGEDASRAKGDATSIANWHGYGAEVLAVADAVVAEAADDLAEAPSLEAATGQVALENASGNYVTLNLGGGRFAFYEHLKHGSVRVKKGQRVKRGQVLAELGNSGSSSSGPHLHFHVADGSDELEAEGLPFVFERFEVLGGFEQIGGFLTGERWKEPATGTGGGRRAELPAPNVVVLFP